MAKVKLFKTTTCPYCKMEGEFLNSHQIPFEEIYVDKDPEAAKQMIELSGQLGVPFTVITKDDGTQATILGFDKGRLSELLGLSA